MEVTNFLEVVLIKLGDRFNKEAGWERAVVPCNLYSYPVREVLLFSLLQMRKQTSLGHYIA